LLDEDGGARVAACYEPGDALELAESLLDTIGHERQPLLREDVAELQGGNVAEWQKRSSIALPLIAQGKLLGMLYGDMRQLFGRFDESDLNLLSMLANQAASALENAELVTTLEDRVAERTAEAEAAREAAEASRADAETAREAAEEANETKSAFLATMSHELRTPLNAIIGFTRIVQRKAQGNLPERQLDNLGKVLGSAEHLLGLINNVLDIAKIEAGRMDVVETQFQPGVLIEQCANTATPLLKQGVELKLEFAPDLPVVVSDQDKVRQILFNLLSNAAKFTHAGAITVFTGTVTSEQSTVNSQQSTTNDQGSRLVIDVTDSGIGMNKEQLGRVFEQFQQADSTTTREYGGTGLGLPISRQLAQLLGGDLTATSVEGEGSTFRLELPL
jgi:signal transduction histidine kinase